MTKTQQQFERWAQREGYHLAPDMNRAFDRTYVSDRTELAWHIWQAATRAARRTKRNG